MSARSILAVAVLLVSLGCNRIPTATIEEPAAPAVISDANLHLITTNILYRHLDTGMAGGGPPTICEIQLPDGLICVNDCYSSPFVCDWSTRKVAVAQ